MAVVLSAAALSRVQRYLVETPGSLGLRFGVSKAGCSGWQHVADLAKDERDGDTVFEQDGVRIYVDAISLPLVDGTQIDLVKQRLGEQFVFRNPHSLVHLVVRDKDGREVRYAVKFAADVAGGGGVDVWSQEFQRNIFDAKFAVFPIATLALKRCAAPMRAIVTGPTSIATRNSNGSIPEARNTGAMR